MPYHEECRLEIYPDCKPVIANGCAVMPLYNLDFLNIIILIAIEIVIYLMEMYLGH